MGSIPSGSAATHQPLLRRLDGRRLNPGSVGLRFQKRGAKDINLAHAEELLLNWTGADWAVTLRRVPYDLASPNRSILASGMPHASWLADGWVPAQSPVSSNSFGVNFRPSAATRWAGMPFTWRMDFSTGTPCRCP